MICSINSNRTIGSSYFVRISSLLLTLLLGLLFTQCSSQSDVVNKGTTSGKSVPKESNTSTVSIHAEHLKYYQDFSITQPATWDSLHGITHRTNVRTDIKQSKEYKVFGWHPHYMGTAYKSYNFQLLWGISYFSYEVNPATGSYHSIHDWKTTEVVTVAQSAGTKVFLTATNFGEENNEKFLDNTLAQSVFADSITALLRERKADGVTIDFEDVPKNSAEKFAQFILFLSRHLKAADSTFALSITLPGIDWNEAYSVEKMRDAVDLFIVMAYDYYYSGSKTAGPVAPLESGTLWEPYNLESTLAFYLKKNIPKKKLLIALPYYGREWHTKDTTIPSSTTKYVSSPLYRTIRQRIDSLRLQANFDTASKTEYLTTVTATKPTQLWFDDSLTLGAKWDWVIQNELGGVGIWALGYDNGYTELWELLGMKFGKKK